MHNSIYFRTKQLNCKQCGKQFVFHHNERIKFAKFGWDHPIRCHACRILKKNKPYVKKINNLSPKKEEKREIITDNFIYPKKTIYNNSFTEENLKLNKKINAHTEDSVHNNIYSILNDS